MWMAQLLELPLSSLVKAAQRRHVAAPAALAAPPTWLLLLLLPLPLPLLLVVVLLLQLLLLLRHSRPRARGSRRWLPLLSRHRWQPWQRRSCRLYSLWPHPPLPWGHPTTINIIISIITTAAAPSRSSSSNNNNKSSSSVSAMRLLTSRRSFPRHRRHRR